MKKRILSIILAIVMVIGMVPTSAFAEDPTTGEQPIVETPIVAAPTEAAPELTYYAVTFVGQNGTVLKVEDVAEGGAATAPDASVLGYRFDGWDKDFSSVTEAMTVTAQYTKLVMHTLSIGYVYAAAYENAPTLPATAVHSYAENEAYSVTSPALAGYAADVAEVAGTMGTADVAVTVTYTKADAATKPEDEKKPEEAAPFIVKSVVNPGTEEQIHTYKFSVDGTVDDAWTQKVVENDKLLAPTAPEKTGYKFMGWFDGETQFTSFNTALTGVTNGETTLVAKFQEVYYVFFVDDQGRVCHTAEGVNGTAVTSADADSFVSVGANKSVTGWYAEANCNDAGFTGTAVPSVTINGADVTLYAQVKEGYWLTFASQGGSYIKPAFYAAGSAASAPAAPTRMGYTFAGWYTEADGGTAVDFASITSSITLYAHWTANTNTKYVVVYNWENADDTGFSFREYETKEGKTGELTAATLKEYEGFEVITEGDKAWSQQTIAGDGSTVVNIYYARNVYTVKFYEYAKSSTLTCKKEEHTHTYTYSREVGNYYKYTEYSGGCYGNSWSRWPKCNIEEHTHRDNCYGSAWTEISDYTVSRPEARVRRDGRPVPYGVRRDKAAARQGLYGLVR